MKRSTTSTLENINVDKVPKVESSVTNNQIIRRVCGKSSTGKNSSIYTMLPILSEDLIAEIFERLPVKFLLRFRSLSKSWCSCIASPSFIRMHYLRSMKTSLPQKVLIRQIGYGEHDSDDAYALHSPDQIVLGHGLGSIGISTLKFPCNRPSIVNSCNGILCLVDDERGRIILWNPSIGRKLTIPDHPYSGDDVEGCFVAVGLGLDPITNDYKIVSLSNSRYERHAKNSFVYSMKTHSWCSIASPATPFDGISSTACFVHGALHWVAYNYVPWSCEHYILTFNLSTHVFGKMSLPEPNWVTIEPTIIDGCLAVISYEVDDYDCWIWVMKEYNNVASWYVLFKVQTLSPDDDGALKKVMQLPTNGYFLINAYLSGLKVYNTATGVHHRLFEQMYDDVDMEMCLETLELLDIGEPEL